MRHFFALLILLLFAVPDPVDAKSLDTSFIRAVMNKQTRRLNRCYIEGLRRNPALAGKVVVRFSMSNGRVLWAKIQTSELNDTTVEDCIVRQLERVRFPRYKSNDVVVISYPLNFRPE